MSASAITDEAARSCIDACSECGCGRARRRAVTRPSVAARWRPPEEEHTIAPGRRVTAAAPSQWVTRVAPLDATRWLRGKDL